MCIRDSSYALSSINPLNASDAKWLHLKVFSALLVYPTIFNFWHSGALAERPNVKNKNSGLDQYGAKAFKQQQFGTSGTEGVNNSS